MTNAEKGAFAGAHQSGISKREYFIGQAISGLSSIQDMTDENIVYYAFNIADIALKKLEDENSSNQ